MMKKHEPQASVPEGTVRDRTVPEGTVPPRPGAEVHGVDSPASGRASAEGTAPARPSREQIQGELVGQQRRRRRWRIVATVLAGLVTVAAIVVLIAIYVLPTLKIYGSSMSPTLEEGDVVVSYKASDYQTGDIVAFYYNNKILVKRVVCGPGDWFDMGKSGAVYINNVRIDEPYVVEEGYGTCDIDLPFQVPQDQYFVMGDERQTSIDSRTTQVGCVPSEQILGRIFLCVWPLSDIGTIE